MTERSKASSRKPKQPSESARLHGILQRQVLANPYIIHRPTEKQAILCLAPESEVLYGGSAGGGKTDGLLMWGLMDIDSPDAATLLLRRTYPMLSQPGGLIPRSKDWLGPSDAKWNEGHKMWAFPSGATLTFGHVQYERDIFNYQGGEYNRIGFDELTQFGEDMYRYIAFSRRRRTADSGLSLKVAATSNPGGVGHDWVKERLVESDSTDRRFIRAGIADNPHLDRAEYERSLMELDPVTRAQLMEGDWDIRPAGAMFQRQWFPIVDAAPAEAKRLRYWDEAATEATPGKDPDWTAGVRLAYAEGVVYVEDMQHFRSSPMDVDKRIRQTAEVDGYGVPVWIEQEPGASGKARVDHLRRIVLPDFALGADRPTGPKPVRAAPVASQAEAGNVKLVRGHWNATFLDEVELFPYGSHDDQVDATSGGYHKLIEKGDYAFAL